MPKLSFYDYDHYDVVKCCQNLKFEKMDTAPYTGKHYGFWLLWGICKEYIKQYIIKAVLRKKKMLIQSSFADWKKINNVNKKRSKRKNWYKLCLWDFISKNESFVLHISFYTTRCRFLWHPIKGPLVCSFSPSLHMMTLNPYLFAPPGATNITTMTSQHT